MKETTLDALVEIAGMHARNVLINVGEKQIMPTWLVIEPKRFDIIGTPWKSTQEKLITLARMRRHLHKVDATMYSLVTEVWYYIAPKGTNLTDDFSGLTPPSERPDRIEAVLAVAADAKSSRGKMWAIVRDADGKVTDLVERGPAHAGMIGGFVGLLQRGN